MANVSDMFEGPAWRPNTTYETHEVTSPTPPKYCVTEMSAAGLIAIASGISAGLWLAIVAVI